MKTYPISEALKAQTALREAAGLGPEEFPIQAFVGMISDEIDAMRGRGSSDDEIARLIESHSAITISAAEIAQYYATPQDRHQE